MDTTIDTYFSFQMTVCCRGWVGNGFQHSQEKRHSSKKNNKYQLLYSYGAHPDYGL